MKRIIEKFNDYRYRKRLKKWAVVNIRFNVRRMKRFFGSEKFKNFVKSTPFVTGCLSALCIALISVSAVLFSRYACPYFDNDARIVRRLSMTEFDSSVPYLRSLSALGSSNRIQITLKTDTENYINPRGVGLDRGGVNLVLTFSDGSTAEFALNNSNYDNFESGMTDTFTVILPFGYTPFDITDYTIAVLPDIKNRYDDWHCRWARVYFLLGGEPVMLARESWESVAVFGGGENAVKSSALEIVHGSNNKYIRSNKIYSYYLSLAQKGAAEPVSGALKADTLDSLGLNGGKFLYLDIETVNIQVQNDILTYYTKGVDIPETDALDYDGRLFLDVTFFSSKPDGGYTESFLLDTLGTDDFELGTTSSFKLEMPEGMCVFDISSMTLRAENPHDAWAPHYVRAYIKPDYSEMLEIARLTDTMLVNSRSTPVFYKNLIDTGVELDLSAQFSISDAVRKKIESEKEFKFSDKIADMYFKLQSFYDRQNVFYEQAVSLYTQSVYNPPEPEPETPDDDTAAPDTDDGLPADRIEGEETPPEESPIQTPENKPQDSGQNADSSDNPVQTPPKDNTAADTPQENRPSDGSPANGSTENGEPADNSSENGNSSDGNPADGSPADGGSADANPGDNTPSNPPEAETPPDSGDLGGVWSPSTDTPAENKPNEPTHDVWNVQEGFVS